MKAHAISSQPEHTMGADQYDLATQDRGREELASVHPKPPLFVTEPIYYY